MHIRRLRENSVALVLIAVYLALGTAINWLFSEANRSGDAGLKLLAGILASGTALAVVVLIVWTLVKSASTLADYGLGGGRGFWINLALSVAFMGFVLSTVGVERGPDWMFVMIVLQAAAEEVVFRAILINRIRLVLDGVRGAAFWAIVISSVLFTAAHMPLKGPQELLGVLVSSCVLALVYVLTGSIVAPIAVHVGSNTVVPYGFLGVAAAIAIGCVTAIVWRLCNKYQGLRKLRMVGVPKAK